MRFAGVAARLLLAGGALVVGLGGAEMLAARLGHSGCGRGVPPLWRPDRDVGWALIPGARADVPVCEGGLEVTRHPVVINEHGQRDRARSFARDPARPRVLVLGDSFVEALQVAQEESFTALLEARLGLDVLNGGVSGYSTDNELRAFATTGRRYQPDLVLLLLHVGNDVLENGARLYLRNPYGLPPKPWLRSENATPALAACLAVDRAAAAIADATPALLWSNSRLVRFALVDGVETVLAAACDGALGPRLIDGAPEILGVYRAPGTRAWEEAWNASEAELSELAQAVASSGATFAVALGPAALEYDPKAKALHESLFPAVRGHTWDFDYPYRRLGGYLDRAGVPWISLAPPLTAHLLAGDAVSYVWDGHWTATGHRIVAESLASFVTDLLAKAGLPR